MAPDRFFSHPVAGIARQGMTDRGHMDPDLVGPARDRGDFEEARLLEFLENGIARLGIPGPAGHDGDARPILPMPADGPVDGPAALRHSAHDQTQVDLVNVSFSELGQEGQIRIPGSRDDQQARRFLVKAVNDARPVRIPHPGQLGKAVKKAVGQGSVPDAGSGMHDQTRRLVDDDDPIVGMKDAEIDTLGLETDFRFLLPGDADPVAGSDAPGRTDGTGLDQDVAARRQLMDPGSGQFRQAPGQKNIDPDREVRFSLDDKLFFRHLFQVPNRSRFKTAQPDIDTASQTLFFFRNSDRITTPAKPTMENTWE